VEQDSIFEQLVGEQLSSVTFVQDYLQLSFDGPRINVFNPLRVKTLSSCITSWSPGFRDLVCGQIGKVVAAVNSQPAEALTVVFEDGSSLSISLLPEDSMGPEAYYANGFKGKAWLVE